MSHDHPLRFIPAPLAFARLVGDRDGDGVVIGPEIIHARFAGLLAWRPCLQIRYMPTYFSHTLSLVC